MPQDWKKVITKNSIAELKTLVANGDISISGSQLIIKNLPDSDPTEAGKLYRYNAPNGESWLKISTGS